MRASLSQYHRKRDFKATPEPRGEVAAHGQALSFVIQKHAARRLHYDFRLELDGTLKSWAVPKGPSLDPHVRRMAVHVEDHPLDYAGFEGVIPAGHYGAGTVIVWDRGQWLPIGDPRDGYRAGKLKFELKGEKLRGRWNLVRIHAREGERQEPWLLIKENDEEARGAASYDVTEALPDSVIASEGAGRRKSAGATDKATKAASSRTKAVSSSSRAQAASSPAKTTKAASAPKARLPLALAPQLATLVDRPPAGAGWIYEVKFDGYRILARIDGEDVRLFTRNGNDWSSRLPALREAVRSLGIASGWLDGEIVALDAKGRPDFQTLQNAFDLSPAQRSKAIVYYVFDAPYLGGEDLRPEPLSVRRERLRKALAHGPSDTVRFSEAFDAPVEQLLASACDTGLEGLIAKRSDAPYASTRSSAWLKLKCTRRQEFVICGYTDPKGSRSGFGSLLLAVHDPSGELRYAGNVGTGFDTKLLGSIKAKLDALQTDARPFDPAPRGVKAHWVKPRLVAEVSFTEWTSDGHVRHPVFEGLRSDKPAESVTREQPVKPPATKPSTKGRSPASASAKGAAKRVVKAGAKKGAAKAPVKAAGVRAARSDSAAVAGIRISNPDRVIDAETGSTKLDLVRYYESVGLHMLPHLGQRPVSLVRAPEGLGGERFFQKHAERIPIPHIVQLSRRLSPGHAPMLAIDSIEALVGAAQMNAVEIHTWNSTARDIAHPDRVIFDLDPGEGVAWESMQEAATLVRQMLEMLGLACFLKTSGGKGLHVVVPLTPRPAWGYDRVKDFSREVVEHLAITLPPLFVAKSGASNRKGRIFVDYLRNGEGATTVAAFSARARPGLGVSVPLAWRELAKLERSDAWNIATLPARLVRQRSDPWKDYAGTRQTLDEAAKRLKS